MSKIIETDIDAVLRLDDERYAVIEIKLGSHEIVDGAKHLLRFND